MHKCICDIVDLMREGCKCGAIQQEKVRQCGAIQKERIDVVEVPRQEYTFTYTDKTGWMSLEKLKEIIAKFTKEQNNQIKYLHESWDLPDKERYEMQKSHGLETLGEIGYTQNNYYKKH